MITLRLPKHQVLAQGGYYLTPQGLGGARGPRQGLPGGCGRPGALRHGSSRRFRQAAGRRLVCRT